MADRRRIWQIGNEDFFENIDSEEKAYWLGFLAADGYVSKATLGVKLHPDDKDHLLKFRDALGMDKPIEIDYRGYPLFRVHSRKIVNDLKKFGFKPNKHKDILPPDLEDELLRHYYRGYLDGDGSIWYRYFFDKRRGKKYFRMCIALLGNKNFVEKYALFVKEKLGIHVYIGKADKNTETWRGIVNGTMTSIKLGDYLYENATIFLERKRRKFEYGKSIWRGSYE